MNKRIEIAGIEMNLTVPFSYKCSEAFLPFYEITNHTDKKINVNFVSVQESIVYEERNDSSERYILLEKGKQKYLGYHIYQKACHAWSEYKENEINCYYLEDSVKYFPTDRQLFYVVCLEQLLNLNHGFVLHSSFVSWNDSGILFTGDSGVGKSTQAELWKEYMSADILNGDRSGVRKVNGEWRAYGLPYAGSSEIYRNESCPVRVIVVLEQASENKLVRLSSSVAFRNLYAQITMHPYDSEFMERLVDDLFDLITCVPIYKLSCLPNVEAVELLKKEIEVI